MKKPGAHYWAVGLSRSGWASQSPSWTVSGSGRWSSGCCRATLKSHGDCALESAHIDVSKHPNTGRKQRHTAKAHVYEKVMDSSEMQEAEGVERTHSLRQAPSGSVREHGHPRLAATRATAAAWPLLQHVVSALSKREPALRHRSDQPISPSCTRTTSLLPPTCSGKKPGCTNEPQLSLICVPTVHRHMFQGP